MKQLQHPNIVELRYCFHTVKESTNDIYLNLVLEYVPDTIYRVIRQYTKVKQTMPMILIKVQLN
jgi:glycogen synthase kinase 3 beta